MPPTAYQAYDSAGKRKYLTAGEGLAFLKAAKRLPPEEALFCELMYYSGCRITEALGIGRDEVDLEEAIIRVRCLKKRGKLVIRRIPLPEQLIRRLLQRPSLENGCLWNFCRMTAWRIIKKAMADAGINGSHASPKGLRHAFGVRAAMAKVPVSVIQVWMGHSFVSTTGIYLAVGGSEERDLMARTWA